MNEADAVDTSAGSDVPAAASQEKSEPGRTLEDSSAPVQDKGHADDVKANEEQGKSEENKTDNNTETAQSFEHGMDAACETAPIEDVEVQKSKRTLEKEGAVGKEACSGAPPKQRWTTVRGTGDATNRRLAYQLRKDVVKAGYRNVDVLSGESPYI